MCKHPDVDYTEFPSRVIGGPSGDYELQIDVPSNQWGEFFIVNISNGAGTANVVVSGNSKQAAKALDYTGATTLNKDNSVQGLAFNCAANTSVFAPMLEWERIQHSQKKVFVRIDVTSGACFVTLRFRMAKLQVVPGQATTVHPDHMHQMNIARADATRQRLGIVKEIEMGEGMSAAQTRAKNERELLHGQK